MAGTSSEMQRHAKEPTEALLFMLDHDRRMVAKEKEAKKKQEEEASEMRKRSEEQAKNSTDMCYSGLKPEQARQLDLERLAKDKKTKKNRNKKEKKKKKAASVTQAGKPEASVTQAGTAEESVADMSSAGGDSFVGEDEEAEKELQKRLETLKNSSGMILIPLDCSPKEMGDLASMHQRDREKERRAMAKRREVEEAELKQGVLLDSQEKLANKKANDEEAEKAEASVTEAGKPEESGTQAGKTEESVTEVGKSVTPASKAAAKTSDASEVLQTVRVFEDAESFGAEFQSFWNSCWSNFCAYDEATTIPAMCYTHNSDAKVRIRDTLQVVSVKVALIKEGLCWPLQVFGTVSARDVVDYKRNIIFHRERDNCQNITEQDPYLALTGPSRAVVVCYDPSYIEVVLKVKGATESDDKELCRLAVEYRLSCFRNGLYPCKLSTLELTFSQVYRSVEATLHIKVTGGSWPYGFKGSFSAATARTECAIVKLLDVGDDGLPVDAADGMIRLSRNVVSVELEGRLKVYVSACSAAGYEEELCEGSFVPEKAGVSPGVELKIGSCLMEATVAWSLFCHDY